MDQSAQVFLFTIAGTIVGAVSSIVVTWINKKSEENWHSKETIIRTAIENWKGAIDLAKFKGRGIISPLDAYIISSIALFGRINFKKLKSDEVQAKLDEVEKISEAALAWFEKKPGQKE